MCVHKWQVSDPNMDGFCAHSTFYCCRHYITGIIILSFGNLAIIPGIDIELWKWWGVRGIRKASMCYIKKRSKLKNLKLRFSYRNTMFWPVQLIFWRFYVGKKLRFYRVSWPTSFYKDFIKFNHHNSLLKSIEK